MKGGICIVFCIIRAFIHLGVENGSVLLLLSSSDSLFSHVISSRLLKGACLERWGRIYVTKTKEGSGQGEEGREDKGGKEKGRD